jgi:hypothetical protein
MKVLSVGTAIAGRAKVSAASAASICYHTQACVHALSVVVPSIHAYVLQMVCAGASVEASNLDKHS